MCNSYEARSNYREFVDAFSVTRLPLRFPPPESAPNLPEQPLVRPTDIAPVIRKREGEAASELVSLKWGFAPPRPKAGPIINFRSEGRRFGYGRAIAPASAFFEYTGDRYPKTRWRVTLAGAPWFGLAALVRPADGAWPESFTLLTCAPGPDIEAVHDRQMVVLRPLDFERWLDPEAEVGDLMRPMHSGSLNVERG